MTIDLPQRILVTGANGFIAAHVIDFLLKTQPTVLIRGTVRCSSKIPSIYACYPYSLHSRLEVVVVPDVTLPTAFDAAVLDCDAILHLASPFGFAYKDFEQELLIPSIRGTESVLFAAKKENSVKRVVVTSSFASIYDAAKGRDPTKVYTEKDWCPLTYEDGKNAIAAPIAYRASKVLAERTAWDFMSANKDLHFDLVTICPGMVFGPILGLKNLTSINASNSLLWSVVKDGPNVEIPQETKAPIWVDVRDLAKAHIEATFLPSAKNQRYLVAVGPYCMQEIADIIHASLELPQELKERVPKGSPGKREAEEHYSIDVGKTETELSISWTDLKHSVVETLLQFHTVE